MPLTDRNLYLNTAIATLQDAWRQNENFSSGLLDLSPVVMFIHDTAGHFLFVNQVWEEVASWKRDDVQGRHVSTIFPSVNLERFLYAHKKVIDSGLPYHSEEVLNSSEAPRFFQTTYFPLRDKTGTISGVGGIGFEITSVRKLEDPLRYSESLAQLRLQEINTIYNGVPLGLCYIDADLRFVSINETLARLNGHPVSAYIGKPLHEFATPELLAEVEACLKQVLESGEPLMNLPVKPTAPGNPYQQGEWRVSYIPVKNSWGTPQGVTVIVQDVGDLTQAEAALRRSEERFQLAANAVRGLIYDVDMQTQQTYRSPGLESLIGYSPEEADPSMQWWSERVHPDDLEIAEKRSAAAIANRADHIVSEYRIRHRNGHYIYVQDNAVYVRDENDQIVRMVGSTTDITQSKEVQQNLQAALERYQFLFDYSPVPLIVLEGRTLTILDLNHAVEVLLGYPKASLLKRSILDLHSPDEAEKISERIQTLLPGLNTLGEWRYQRQDGTLIYAEATAFPAQQEGREVRLLALYDVTEKRRAQQSLVLNEHRLRLTLQAAHSGSWDWNIIENRMYWSPEYYEVFGQDPQKDTPTYERWMDTIHPEDQIVVQNYIQQVLETGETPEIEYRILHPMRGVRWISARGSLFTDPEGKPIRMVGMSMDITERKETEQEIERLNVRLQRAMRETHHRVKNNLQSLSALIDMQRLTGNQVVPMSVLNRISQHIQTLAALHDLLTQEARQNADAEKVSLQAALERLLTMLQATASPRELLLDAEEITFSATKSSSFVLIVSELVSNAIKHGEGDIQVRLHQLPTLPADEERHQNPRARLEVCNEGAGFAPDFDPKEAANTGLDLIDSLAHWDLQGVLSFVNPPEGGACVTVEFSL